MPKIGDMLEVVDLLKVGAVAVDQERCVAVRNRNSKCRKCADACIAEAITIAHNTMSVDAGACVNCGCCVAVCPTGAIHALDPTEQHVESRVARTANPKAGFACFACARKASKNEGDPEKYVEVPCLGHLSETILLRTASAGIDDILLVDGDCASCRFGAASPRIDETVYAAADLIEGSGSEAIVTRSSEFPPELLDAKRDNLRGKSRRGIMRQTGNYVKTVAGNVAQHAIEEQLGVKKEPVTLRDRLGAGKSGRMPTFEPERNYRIIESMERLSSGKDPESLEPFYTRRFGNVRIDPEACSGCGMCVMFCPTAALRYSEFEEPEDEGLRYLEFQAADCTQCMLCKDVCLRDCLEVDGQVSLAELLDLEPRLVEIARPDNRTNIFSLRQRNQRP